MDIINNWNDGESLEVTNLICVVIKILTVWSEHPSSVLCYRQE